MSTRTCNCVFNIDQSKKDAYHAVCEGLCRGLYIDADEALDLFTYDPKADHPVVRIPAITVTKNKTVLVAIEMRENADDNSSRRIMYRRSVDSGSTWTKAKDLLSQADLARFADQTIHNPTFVSLSTGEILFLFGINYQELWLSRSVDDGVTFESPVELTEDIRTALNGVNAADGWKLIASGPGNGIQLLNGRVLVPVWLSFSESEHRPSVSLVIASDDKGETWQTGDIIAPTADDDWTNPSEGTLVEMADGSIVMNFRHEGGQGYRLFTRSADGLTSWSKPEYQEEMPDPVCHAGATRHPSEGWQAFINCARKPMNEQLKKGQPDGRWDDRQQLALRFSIDEGKTWPKVINIAQDAGYSTLTWTPDGSAVYVVFEQGRVKGEGSLPNSIKYIQIHVDKKSF